MIFITKEITMVKKCTVPHSSSQPSHQQVPPPRAPVGKGIQLASATTIALSWAAGFFDGDGGVMISKQQILGRKNPTYRLRACVVQNCWHTIKHFRDVVDEPHFMAEVKRQVEHNRQIYSLVYDGMHALAVLRKLEPFLVRKQTHARAAFRFWQEANMGTLPGMRGLSPDAWQKREFWYDKLQNLNK